MLEFLVDLAGSVIGLSMSPELPVLGLALALLRWPFAFRAMLAVALSMAVQLGIRTYFGAYDNRFHPGAFWPYFAAAITGLLWFLFWETVARTMWRRKAASLR